MAMIDHARRSGLQHRGSLQHDLERGDRTEIDFLCGAIVRKVRELGLEAPCLETLYRLIKGMEYNIGAH
jgi:2-dehydropantoate 2-reductase